MAKELGGVTTDGRLGRTTGCRCIDAKWCVNANSFEGLQKRVNLRNNQQLLLKRQGTHWNGEHYVDGEPDPYITCLFEDTRHSIAFHTVCRRIDVGCV